MYRFLITVIVFSTSFVLLGQNPASPAQPLRKLVLVSTFGELRPDHFHSGVDFSGFYRIGDPVFAIDTGYVSRIKVSADGYGKAVYIMHPDGTKSVYGHLDRFNPQIDSFVRNQQYFLQSYEVDLYLFPWQIPVSKGQIIGYVGNTGRSYAPHLHFELRRGFLDYPVNPLVLGYKIADSRPPVITKIAVYPASDTSLVNGKHQPLVLPAKSNLTIPVSGAVYFGIEAFDFVDNHRSKKGVYSVKLFIDDSIYLWYQFDRFFFQNTRYVNALLDYKLYLTKKIKIQRSYITPNNRLCIYKYVKNNGIFVPVAKSHKITYIVADFYGNTTEFTFWIKTESVTKTKSFSPKGKLIDWRKAFWVDTSGVKVYIPAMALYDTTYFNLKIIHNNPYPYAISPLYVIHSHFVPVNSAITVWLKPDSALDQNLLIVYVDYKNRTQPLKTLRDSSWLKAQSLHFGKFYIAYDTVKPQCKLLTKPVLPYGKKLIFKITDNFSYIKNYDVYVNNQWTLFEYDAKTKTLTTTVDSLYFSDTNTVKVKLTDLAGNKSQFEYQIIVIK